MTADPSEGVRPTTARPLEIVWSNLALARLREIRAFVAADKPVAAERLAARIVAVVEALRVHPYLGRSGSKLGIRELVIGGTPYIILYRVRTDRVVVQTIWHGAQRDTRVQQGSKSEFA